jgi:hypothetical protein
MTDNARKMGPAVEANIQFLMRLVPAVEKFPRTKMFLIGDRIGPPLTDALCVGESGIGPKPRSRDVCHFAAVN